MDLPDDASMPTTATPAFIADMTPNIQ